MDPAARGLGLGDLLQARARVATVARLTPLLRSEALSERCGRPVFLKCESLQVGGAFKIRGATNFIAQAVDAARAAAAGHTPGAEAVRGLITFSSGNHAIATALGARRAGLPAVVVMPENAPAVKVERVRALGAELHFAGTTSPERKARAEALRDERGLTMVPPFDHPWIVAGQASCGLEILEQLPGAEVILVPVGGGGLLAGIALACAQRKPGVRVVGVEPEGAARMSASLRAGSPVTLAAVRSIADGLLPSRPGDLTFDIARRHVAEVVTVGDEAIAEAAAFLLKTEHLLVEWSGAVGVAALLRGAAGVSGMAGGAGAAGGAFPSGLPTVVVLSGGNADPRALLERSPSGFP
jgi:threonine dehydratase